MKSYSKQQYLDTGCRELVHASMIVIHGMTRGKVCDTGCHAFNKGQCEHYKRLIKGPSNEIVYSNVKTETVKEEAGRRGVSIREVRRQRRDLLGKDI
jgi:hypothetical protein